MSEQSGEFQSFDEAAAAIRTELGGLEAGGEFPNRVFDLIPQALKLKTADETMQSQLPGLLQDLQRQRIEWSSKFQNADEIHRRKIIADMRTGLTNFLNLIERR